jgi:hypothetical protein
MIDFGMTCRIGAVAVTAALAAAPAQAQVSIGAGPLTTTLSEQEPTTGALTIGPVKVAPGVVVRELGYDSNVFDEAVDPKEDYLVAIVPDVSAFTRLRFLKATGYAGIDVNRFNTYTSENSVGNALRGRVDILLSRMRPFIGAGHTKQRTRPNGEIDVRALRIEDELSGGLAFDLSPHSLVYGSALRFGTEFEDAFEDGVALAPALNRKSYEYSGGLRTDLTPLTSLTMFGAFREDKFELNPLRNGETWSANAAVRMGSDAVVTGVIAISYRDFNPIDPNVEPFRGLGGSIALRYPFLEMGHFNLTANRGTEYSFDTLEAYFLENTIALSYTQRLFGGVDAQVRGGRSLFDYGYHQQTPAHQDTLDVAGGSLGYNLANRTRISLNYEVSERRSPELPERNYERRRIYLAWTFAY